MYKQVPAEQKVLVDVKNLFTLETLRGTGYRWWKL
jgi:hypothetical protein